MLIFAGDQGTCAITITVAGRTAIVPGSVHRFSPTPLSYVDLGGAGNNVDVSGSYAYAAVAGVGLRIVDVSDRLAITDAFVRSGIH